MTSRAARVIAAVVAVSACGGVQRPPTEFVPIAISFRGLNSDAERVVMQRRVYGVLAVRCADGSAHPQPFTTRGDVTLSIPRCGVEPGGEFEVAAEAADPYLCAPAACVSDEVNRRVVCSHTCPNDEPEAQHGTE
jgi:hypothetical protein